MDKFVRFFRTVSWVLFLVVLLWSYASLRGEATFSINESSYSLSKSNFFFALLITFFVFNIPCLAFKKVMKKVNTTEEGKGLRNRWLKKELIMLSDGLSGILTFFLFLVAFYVGYSSGDKGYQPIEFGYLLYIGPIMLVAWAGHLVKVLLSKKHR